MDINNLTDKIIDGYKINKDESLKLLEFPLDILSSNADRIRQHFCGNTFDACTIINIKSGKCSENCKFCAQSTFYDTDIEEYFLLSKEELHNQTEIIYKLGFKRISYVSSGRLIPQSELNTIIGVINNLKKEFDDINLCVSLGLLTKNQIQSLEDSGIDRIHNNLETSRDYFKQICTTHSFDSKITTLENIKESNVNICSGGIFGLGESFEDRVDLALTLRQYNIRSIPINILNPIKNTPLENNSILTNDEVCRIVAIFRFINPDSYIRMAGGRLLLSDHGRRAFQSGSNAAILGNMLTTKGVEFEEDINMIKELGYNISYGQL